MKPWIKPLLFAVCALPLLAVAADDDVSKPAPNPDPWESFNRKVFAFNDFADRWFLKPVAKGYDRVTPQFLESGIHNMFANLGEVSDVLNGLLQAKFKNSDNSWMVDAKGIDKTVFDLSVRNPNKADGAELRDPKDIIAEMVTLDAESAAILKNIEAML